MKKKLNPGGSLPEGSCPVNLIMKTVQLLQPKSVLDVGCGPCAAMHIFAENGVETEHIKGLEADLSLQTHEKVNSCDSSVIWVSLNEASYKFERRFDLVWSYEVAEHIDREEFFIATITDNAEKFIVMTAAAPGQTGYHHVNCQPQAHWIKLIEARGFAFERDITELLKAANLQDNQRYSWFVDNGMVFSRRTG